MEDVKVVLFPDVDWKLVAIELIQGSSLRLEQEAKNDTEHELM